MSYCLLLFIFLIFILLIINKTDLYMHFFRPINGIVCSLLSYKQIRSTNMSWTQYKCHFTSLKADTHWATDPCGAGHTYLLCYSPTNSTRQGPSWSCTALDSFSSSTGRGCHGKSRHSGSLSTSTRPCRVITWPSVSNRIRVGIPEDREEKTEMVWDEGQCGWWFSSFPLIISLWRRQLTLPLRFCNVWMFFVYFWQPLTCHSSFTTALCIILCQQFRICFTLNWLTSSYYW